MYIRLSAVTRGEGKRQRSGQERTGRRFRSRARRKEETWPSRTQSGVPGLSRALIVAQRPNWFLCKSSGGRKRSSKTRAKTVNFDLNLPSVVFDLTLVPGKFGSRWAIYLALRPQILCMPFGEIPSLSRIIDLELPSVDFALNSPHPQVSTSFQNLGEVRGLRL